MEINVKQHITLQKTVQRKKPKYFGEDLFAATSTANTSINIKKTLINYSKTDNPMRVVTQEYKSYLAI